MPKTNNKVKQSKTDEKLTRLVYRRAVGQSYILVIKVDSFVRLLIGKLGYIDFKQGYYIYIGSARRTIQKRLLRHLAREKNRFWHIDYLLSFPSPARVIDIWVNPEPYECAISLEIFQSKIGQVVKNGFGSSDCRCPAHLFRINISDFATFRGIVTKGNFHSLSE